MTTADRHPAWCARHETRGFPHMAAIGDVESGVLVLTVDLCEADRQPAAVVLGLYGVGESMRHVLTIECADQLRYALGAAVDAARRTPRR